MRFWDALDAVGLAGYFELMDADEPLDELALASAWRPIVQSVDTLAAELEKPVIVTEVGYTSQQARRLIHGTTLGRELDLAGQQTLYTALARAWSKSTRRGDLPVGLVWRWRWAERRVHAAAEARRARRPSLHQGQRPSASPP